MTRKLRTIMALCVGAAALVASASAQAPPSAPRAGGPPELFRAALPDMPGKQLVVVALSIAP
jgi:hypothetical protein